MQYPSFVYRTKEGYCNDIRSIPERILYHADAKRMYIMRGNSRVYHIAQRYIIDRKTEELYNSPSRFF